MLRRTGVLYVCRQDITTAYCFIFERKKERERGWRGGFKIKPFTHP